MNTIEKNNLIIVRFSKQLYENIAILTSAYKLTNRCDVQVNADNQNEYEVTFKPIYDSSIHDLQLIVDEFSRDIIDQQLRLDLDRQFGKIKELIVEHAFKPVSDLKKKLEGE